MSRYRVKNGDEIEKTVATQDDILHLAMVYGVLNLLTAIKQNLKDDKDGRFKKDIQVRIEGFELLLKLCSMHLELKSKHLVETIDRVAATICHHFKIMVETKEGEEE